MVPGDASPTGDERTLEVDGSVGGSSRGHATSPGAGMDDTLASDATHDSGSNVGERSASRFDDAVPRKIGRFDVLRQLGAGGMGVVFAAYDDELDRRVAVKVLLREGRDATERLRREAQAMAKLSHPNVAQIYEVGTVGGRLFLAMEFIKGRTLKAWRAEASPEWEEVLSAMIQAGRGLAAAHKAGLVHRDFKPENVMIGEDGRVRVLDFGLARTTDLPGSELELSSAALEQLGGQHSDAFDGTLTEAGALLGTPAYMSPEQMRGAEAGPKTDQFSYCVTLYELLYGRRPFQGGSLSTLIMQVLRGEVLPPPKGTKVPVAIQRAITRGLSVEEDARHPDMDALLAELDVSPGRRRGAWGFVGAAVLAAGVLAVAMQGGEPAAADPCQGAEARLEGAWDGTRKAAVRDAILGSRLGFADSSWSRVEGHLDAYADGWVAAHRDACEATSVRAEQSTEVLDLRMGCLQTRLRDLEALTGVLAQTKPEGVESAVAAAASLPSLEACSNLEYLQARIKPPTDPDTAREVERIREDLARAASLERAHDFEPALALAAESREAAESLDYEPLLAEALAREGELLRRTGAFDESEAALIRAFELAARVGHDEAAADAATSLVGVVGGSLQRHDEGLKWWGRMARVELDRTRADEMAYADLDSQLGHVLYKKGEYDAAAEKHRAALDVRERVLGSDNPLVGHSYTSLAHDVHRQGDYAKAEELHRHGLQVLERALGEDHPETAAALGAVALMLARQGKYAEGEAMYRRAIALVEAAYGKDHPSLGAYLGNLGLALHNQGRLEEAAAAHERALHIYETRLGKEHPDVTKPLDNLGLVYASLGQWEKAETFHRRSIELAEKTLGPKHPSVALTLDNLGADLRELGRYEEAEALHHRALEIQHEALGADNHRNALSYDQLGLLMRKQERWEESAKAFRNAAAVELKALGPDHPRLGSTTAMLADVLAQSGKPDEAETEYRKALKILEPAVGADSTQMAFPLLGLAELRIGKDGGDEAIELAERGVKIQESHEVEAADLAWARWILARALAAGDREPERAKQLAEQARDGFASVGERGAEELAEVERWLKRRP